MAMIQMQASWIKVLILLLSQVGIAHTSSSGPSLRGSDTPRSLGSFTPDMDTTFTAFWDAYPEKNKLTGSTLRRKKLEAQMKIEGNWEDIEKAVKDAGIADAKEFAMFIANVMHETGQLEMLSEIKGHYDESSYDWGVCTDVDVSDPHMDYCRWKDENGEEVKETDLTKCCEGANCKSKGKCTKQYSGRGYLQTSWYKNYKWAKEAGCDKDGKVDILTNPEKVADDETLAWCTAAHYWKKNVHDDRCKTKDDGSAGCEMGNSIAAINGDLECGENPADKKKQQAQKRFCLYKYFYQFYAKKRIPVWWADSVCTKGKWRLDENCPVKSR